MLERISFQLTDHFTEKDCSGSGLVWLVSMSMLAIFALGIVVSIVANDSAAAEPGPEREWPLMGLITAKRIPCEAIGDPGRSSSAGATFDASIVRTSISVRERQAKRLTARNSHA